MAIMTALRETSGNAAKRRPWFGKDQHGRLWFANMDIQTGETVGRYEPAGPERKDGNRAAPWSAPWMPPQQYLLRKGNYKILIDYDTWIADQDRANREYRDALIRTGIKLHGQAFDPETPTVAVLHEVGPAPTPVEVPVAMSQGNKFALGLSSVVDDRLERFLPRHAGPAARWRGDEFAEPKYGRPKPAIPDVDDLDGEEDEDG